MGEYSRVAATAFFLLLMASTARAGNVAPALAEVNDWLYVLQPGAVGLPAIQATSYDACVIDYSSDGLDEYSAAEIAALRASHKVVVAYLSIGEAEDYRYYWNPIWNDQPAPDPHAPSWLGPFNPDFPNNYKVRYWQSGWRSILFGTTSGPSKSYLDRIIDQGFDGIYLDIVDAFTYWADDGEVTRQQARLDMLDLIQDLATYARVTRNRPNFLVIPQNGLDVVRDDDEQVDAAGQAHLGLIDAVGVEDLFWNGTVPQDQEDMFYRLTLLTETYQPADVVVVLVDYVWDPASGSFPNALRYNDFAGNAHSFGFIPYAAVPDRGLDEIVTITAGGNVQYSQPVANTHIVFRDGFDDGTLDAWSAWSP